MKNRPYILTIAGFDPSNGAGLTADIKTIEALKGYGLSVCTANTVQNDVEFKACHWTAVEVIKSQIELLYDRFDIGVVKIGIVQDWKILNDIIDVLLKINPEVKIVLDPILRSSSDFDFHSPNINSSNPDKNQNSTEILFDEILEKIYLVTPNYQEIEKLYNGKSIEETIDHISAKTNMFLKGGHRKEDIGKDELFIKKGKRFLLNPKGQNISEKHGSGCVISSAIATNIALGFPLLKACFKAKRYTEKVLSSNKTLLGYHRI
ncbi:hydroxymethylpyrimidine/phosphomethylpyrimidine kinase [Aquimarina sp. 2201CG5-10]|uniref:hydroxymethylpyrimidine/phosphomethylpyrimidine kinase n=1 Tax=Aquimarina callyspongiae TaxID=3098150 RepID=UPI002AB372C3|nr:hydroxymethylpyrimidine/phosphomethylpyrimidine kinase [Aquimarina sp. 2201CG5-10]MDY8135026.1 hydroxymethylpyrimidine/phosphomethylpyrimidine kinase [Aquimarina sp. 2201CG5-10]